MGIVEEDGNGKENENDMGLYDPSKGLKVGCGDNIKFCF